MECTANIILIKVTSGLKQSKICLRVEPEYDNVITKILKFLLCPSDRNKSSEIPKSWVIGLSGFTHPLTKKYRYINFLHSIKLRALKFSMTVLRKGRNCCFFVLVVCYKAVEK